MLYQNLHTKNIYYDNKNVLKCPKCNNLIFYVEEEYVHECSIDNKTYNINQNEKFMCDINNIDFKCEKHQKDFLYYKNSNYYCSECIKENNSEDYLNLDFITLTKNEINDFNKIIIDSEHILADISIMKENYINKIIDSYEIFMKRNNSLIEYCKGLLKFNEKYNKNYNLISTIRRISININKINELKYNNLINFYDNENIIKFNNEFKYKINEKEKYILNQKM